MGTTLTGTTPQDTYDSLIKVTDNGPIGATAKLLSDGLGNDSSLALSTTFTSIRSGNQLRLYRTDNGIYGSIQYLTGAGGFKFDDANGDGYTFAQGADTRLAITSTGNVGIGTSTVSAFTRTLKINTAAGDANTVGFLLTDGDVDRAGFYCNGGATTPAYIFTNDTKPLVFSISGAERFRMTSNGLTFNGDTAAANALDDYEEGTWTMGVSFGGASVGVTTSSSTGTYTKVGRQVTVNGYLFLTSKGSSTGLARITGLPFTVANTNGNLSSASLFFQNITFANQFQGYAIANSQQISLEEITEAGATSTLTEADFANNSGIIVNLTYFV